MEKLEQQRYPAMPALPEVPLTTIATPASARAALASEAATIVIDPDGMRRGFRLRMLQLLLGAVLCVALIVNAMYFFTHSDEQYPLWPTLLLPAVIVLNTLTMWAGALTRAVPHPDTGRLGARLRQEKDIRALPAPPPPASWPPGAEAYAVLSAAATVATINPVWLAQRVGLPPPIGAQWVTWLRSAGWLAGGGHILGVARLPELHVKLTPAGHARLEQERARLTALAATAPTLPLR